MTIFHNLRDCSASRQAAVLSGLLFLLSLTLSSHEVLHLHFAAAIVLIVAVASAERRICFPSELFVRFSVLVPLDSSK